MNTTQMAHALVDSSAFQLSIIRRDNDALAHEIAAALDVAFYAGLDEAAQAMHIVPFYASPLDCAAAIRALIK